MTDLEDSKVGAASQEVSKTNSNVEYIHNKLIINFIPTRMTQAEFFNLFSPYGEIRHIRLMMDTTYLGGCIHQYHQGFGFVEYCTSESAKKARDALNGLHVFEKTLRVSYARPASPDIKDANLYIANLPQSYTEQDLIALFSECGTVINCNILKNANGSSRRIGFVRMNTHSEAENAIIVTNGMTLNSDSVLVVKFAKRHSELMYNNVSCSKTLGSGKSTLMYPVCLHIYNLAKEVKYHMLGNYLSKFGVVLQVRVFKFSDGSCNGYAYAIMDHDGGFKAATELNGRVFCGRTLCITVTH